MAAHVQQPIDDAILYMFAAQALKIIVAFYIINLADF
jgi:hypothetical protein